MERSRKSGIPLWLMLVLCGVIVVMALAISFMVLSRLDIIRCVPIKKADAAATPAPVQPAATNGGEQPAQQTDAPSGLIIITPDPALPEPIVTPEPTEEPTPKPTEVPTATPVPDSFTFGGKNVKVGATKINGKSLGINGKKNKLTHITDYEVEDLLALCPALEELELEYCYMDDYTPLGKLTKLRKLQLSNCNSGGGGNAVKDIDWVENLTELRSLNFSYNKIDDTTAIGNLTRLTYLNLGSNPLENEDMEPLSNLKNLEKLLLYDMKRVTDVQPLSKLSKLKFLNIGRNSRLKNIKPLTKLKKLSELRIYHTNISDISYFKNFAALKKLDLGKCPILFLDYYYLEDCAKLRKIVLEKGDEDAALAIDDMINNGYPFEISYDW